MKLNLTRTACAALTAGVLAAGQAHASTIVGGATLVDTATVHAGTVSVSDTLDYVSGGNGSTGTADGSTYTLGGYTAAAAMAGVDHVWLQFDAAILMHSPKALNAVLAIPAIDHGWTSGNTGEFWEPFEFRIFGCTAASTTACSEEGVITDVWARGVDDSGAAKNADDWTTRWAFRQSYNYFAIFSGDRLSGGPWSPGEGEIDALAVPATVPEPATMALLGLGLAGIACLRRRS